MERGRAKSPYYSAPGDSREPPPYPFPQTRPFFLSHTLRWEQSCVKDWFLIAEESYYLMIISTIVILFIRSGWFPAAYTEQIIAVLTGWIFSTMHVDSEKA